MSFCRLHCSQCTVDTCHAVQVGPGVLQTDTDDFCLQPGSVKSNQHQPGTLLMHTQNEHNTYGHHKQLTDWHKPCKMPNMHEYTLDAFCNMLDNQQDCGSAIMTMVKKIVLHA